MSTSTVAARDEPRPAAALSISAVICAHTMDRWDDLRAAVASVLAQSRPADEVVVVIDHNEELLTRARGEFEGGGVSVLASEGAPGIAGARNTGVRHTAGHVIAFLDDDARAHPDWLAALARVHADPSVTGTSGRVEPLWPGRRPSWMPPELHWIVGCSYRGLPRGMEPLRGPIGASMSFVRAAFDDAGGFDEALGRLRKIPMSCEDTEFGVRALRARPGTTVLFLPEPPARHAVTPARTTWRYLLWRCWTEGRAKAELTRLVGAGAGLADERPYVARVLPAAFLAGLRDAVRGDRAGLGRAAAIVAALGVTGAGYAYGMAAPAPPSREDWS
jgi:GT2 family glycosyltransferase